MGRVSNGGCTRDAAIGATTGNPPDGENTCAELGRTADAPPSPQLRKVPGSDVVEGKRQDCISAQEITHYEPIRSQCKDERYKCSPGTFNGGGTSRNIDTRYGPLTIHLEVDADARFVLCCTGTSLFAGYNQAPNRARPHFSLASAVWS